MKKLAIFFASLTLTIVVFSCGAKDDKNKEEAYPTTDTTQRMEQKNDNSSTHDTTSHRTP